MLKPELLIALHVRWNLDITKGQNFRAIRRIPYTVEPGYNDPLNNEVLAAENDFFTPIMVVDVKRLSQ